MSMAVCKSCKLAFAYCLFMCYNKAKTCSQPCIKGIAFNRIILYFKKILFIEGTLFIKGTVFVKETLFVKILFIKRIE